MNFLELRLAELPRIPVPRPSVNKDQKSGSNPFGGTRPFPLSSSLSAAGDYRHPTIIAGFSRGPEPEEPRPGWSDNPIGTEGGCPDRIQKQKPASKDRIDP